jgi:Arc/MetJ family transcription regulator
MCTLGSVRTNIEIDDELLAKAQAIAGTDTKRATVDHALRELVRRRDRQRALELRGKVRWEGDLARQRRSRAT